MRTVQIYAKSQIGDSKKVVAWNWNNKEINCFNKYN